MKKDKSNGKPKFTNGKPVLQAVGNQEKEVKKNCSSKNPQQIQETIRLKAYELYLERGGSDVENWADAEKIVLKNCR